MNDKTIAQAYADTNGRPYSVWEVGVEWIIDPDFDKSFDTWLASYKKKYYLPTMKELHNMEDQNG